MQNRAKSNKLVGSSGQVSYILYSTVAVGGLELSAFSALWIPYLCWPVHVKLVK